MERSCALLTKRVLKPSLKAAAERAIRARETLTPESSNNIRPSLKRNTHLTTSPLPLPIRTSVGFWVTGTLGNTRIHSLPIRFTCFIMATLAASICEAAILQPQQLWRPNAPNSTRYPAFGLSCVRPLNSFLCFETFGWRSTSRESAESSLRGSANRGTEVKERGFARLSLRRCSARVFGGFSTGKRRERRSYFVGNDQ